MKEKVIEDWLKDYCKKLKFCWCQKIHGNEFVQGVPDLLICYRGRFIAVETKAPEGQGRGLQKRNVQLINLAQGTAFFCRSKTKFLECIATIDKEQDEYESWKANRE